MPATTISTLNEDQVQEILQWAGTEGWNPGVDDAAAFYNADKSGFYGISKAGTLQACISIVRQNSTHAFLGLYICLPQYRGQGVGYTLWQHAIEDRKHFNIALDGVVEQQDNYQQSGFNFAWCNRRFSGVPSTRVNELPSNHRIVPVIPALMDDVIQLDANVGGLKRKQFMYSWLQDTATRKTLLLLADDTVAGVCTIRQCLDGHKLGPVIASNNDQAVALVNACAQAVNAEQIIVDIPSTNLAANALAKELGWNVVFETARMYLGDVPEVDESRLYGVATLELG